ncbi:tetratricopeptide repeat protein [Polaromonas glacialis]|uniref:tetratricopeptide repeat protein n=1 Tax=Polaromonas glacialis TaxID=866564 RepID=UPI0038CD9183
MPRFGTLSPGALRARAVAGRAGAGIRREKCRFRPSFRDDQPEQPGRAAQHPGRLRTGEPLYRRSLEVSERTLGANHPDRAVLLNNLALFYFWRHGSIDDV